MKKDSGRGLIEDRIQEAISRGEFDNLPGKGKPLKLTDQANVEQGMRLAFHILKNAGMAPAWLEKQKELRSQIDCARADLQRSLEHPVLGVREEARARFRVECENLNRAIRAANLEVPAVSLHMCPLNCGRELAAAEKASEAKK
jgi:hypothetical protein